MSTDPKLPQGANLRPGGLAVLSGALLDFARRLDAVFVSWATSVGAQEYRFPSFMNAEHLHRLEYFRSFPHLATFPVTLDDAPENLKAFAEQTTQDRTDAPLQLTDLSPVNQVLTPAACYHIYVQIEGTKADAARFFTTRATCFRREEHYKALERLWNFSMREIVCVGTQTEVEGFLDDMGSRAMDFIAAIGLDVSWQSATDPFFRPLANQKYLYQKLEPVKRELVFADRLAIGSTNLHHQHFGEIFDLQRDGKAAYSGCIAFGIERWLSAFTDTFGDDVTGWPGPEAIDA